jgi:hypothetical protein
MKTPSSRLRVLGAVAAPVAAAALAWAPLAHAADPGVLLPGTNAVAAAPPAQVLSTASAATESVEATVATATATATATSLPVRAVAHKMIRPTTRDVAETVAVAAPTAAHVPPVAATAADTTGAAALPAHRVRIRTKSAANGVPDPPAARISIRHPARRQAIATSRPDRSRVAAAPSPARVAKALPSRGSPSGASSGADTAGTGSGVAPSAVALAATFASLAALLRGRRVVPSIADGRGCALTLDLERPD